MHHPRPAQLDPARVFTNPATRTFAFEATEIELSARLGERKVRWPEARDRVSPEHASQKLRDRSFQMRHRDAAVNAQTFNLEEHRIVRGIGSIAPKHATG